ncbi:Beta-lactamase-like protein [Paramyrothecium foliicola]|nr:Beta-lactamase-like protein [Paramyrothecium foliicola]
MPSISTLLAAFAASSLLISADAKICPPLGAVLPPPKSPSKSEDVQKASKMLVAGLDAIADKLNTSGISIAVKSLHEDELLFNYHHTPSALSGIGTNKIDEDTIYRVGSISKMFPTLLALQNPKIKMDDSILKYLPQLHNSTKNDLLASMIWEDVTIESLTDHLSGLATDLATDLAAFPSGPWTDMGLPEVKKGTGPQCSGLGDTETCTSKDLIAHINSRPPVFNTYTSPSYSNIAFALLSMVVESATGGKFEDLVKEGIYDVAGMKSSSFNGPVSSFDKKGFVPQGEVTWNGTLGVFEPAGGMFSSTNDLIAFAEAIYRNRLLSPKETRKWMKPHSHTSTYGYSVGGPWEILRSDQITTDGRLIDVYTKSGDLGLYHALMGIVPDYDIVVSVMTAGQEVTFDAHARTKMFSAIISHLLPAIEKAGKDEVASPTGYSGTYVDESTNSTIVLEVDDGPGLSISEFRVRGFDVLNNIGFYSLQGAEGLKDPKKPKPAVVGRLYPTKSGQSKTHALVGNVAWRAAFDAKTDEQKTHLDDQIFFKDASCETWFSYDRASYNYQSLAEFVYHRNQAGEVRSIKNPAFGVTMAKVSDNSGRDSKDGGSGNQNGGGGSDSGNGSEEANKGGDANAPPSAASTLGSSTALAALLGTVLIALQL